VTGLSTRWPSQWLHFLNFLSPKWLCYKSSLTHPNAPNLTYNDLGFKKISRGRNPRTPAGSRLAWSECRHFWTPPSFWLYHAPTKLSWWYLKRFKSYRIDNSEIVLVFCSILNGHHVVVSPSALQPTGHTIYIGYVPLTKCLRTESASEPVRCPHASDAEIILAAASTVAECENVSSALQRDMFSTAKWATLQYWWLAWRMSGAVDTETCSFESRLRLVDFTFYV